MSHADPTQPPVLPEPSAADWPQWPIGAPQAALDTADRRWPRRAIVLFLLAVWLFLAVTVWQLPADDPWRIGDWLINWRGGFVRRGLIGELLLALALGTGLSLPALAKGVALATVSAFLLGLWALIRPLPVNRLTALLLLSPALLLFYVHNPAGAFRKDWLLLALLAGHCVWLARQDARPGRRYRVGLSLVLAALVLCHEALYAYLPWFVIALQLHGERARPAVPADIRAYIRADSRAAIWTDFLILLPATVAIIVVVLAFRGSAEAAAAICTSLGDAAPRDCIDPALPGAVRYIGADLARGQALVDAYTPWPTLATYAGLALLASWPLLLAWRDSSIGQRLHRHRSPAAFAALALLLLQLPLLAVMADYGRMIHLLTGGATLVTLLAMRLQGAALRVRPLRWPRLMLALSILFVFGWKLSHCRAVPEKAFWLLGLAAA